MMLLNVPVYLVIPLEVSQREDCIEREKGKKGEGVRSNIGILVRVS